MAHWRRGRVAEFSNERWDREVPWPLGFAPPVTEALYDKAGEYPEPPGLMAKRRAMTEAQALMETAPGGSPEESVESQAELADLLADAIEDMPERLRWVFQAKVNRGLSFRQIATELGIGKSWAHRLYRQAVEHLRDALGDHPLILERLR